jgi:uncharacterized protein YbjT (DUF2867 family)
MNVKPILFGSTGMVGKGVLLECLDSTDVGSVLVVNRQACGITHPKLKEIILPDFSDLSSLSGIVADYNACFFCLGVSAVGLSENEYHRITYDLTTRAAQALLQAHTDFTFCYVSGAGTDSSEKGRIMWARVKGKTENALLAMPFRQAYMFRPGYIQPLRGIRSKTAGYQLFYTIFKPLYFLLKPFKSIVTDTTSLGKAMINTVTRGYSKKILESADINRLAAVS